MDYHLSLLVIKRIHFYIDYNNRNTNEEVNDIEEASSLVQETIKDPDVSIKKMNEYSGFLSLNQAYLLTALCDFFGYVIRTIGYIK